MGNRAPIQTSEAELPAAVLLWGERKCHQDTGLGDAHRQLVSNGDAEALETMALELLWACDNDQNYADVLRQHLNIP